MKAKKIITGMSVAASVLLMMSCTKPKVAPQPDTEFGSSVNASYALFSITDAEMMGSFMAENYFPPTFYNKVPGSVGDITTIQNLDADQVSVGFNQTTCMDACLRDGTVQMFRGPDPTLNPNANANSRYYRRFGFAGKLTFSNYIVDGWQIVTVDADNATTGQECIITNRLASDSWDPATTNLSWSIKGNFRLTKGNEEIFCRLDLVKTLTNTNDPAVFPRNRTAINWDLATVAYSGKVTGFTNDKVPFTLVIDEKNPITRDFTCSPDRVTGITVSNRVITQSHEEFHPFKNGVAYFTTGQLYPREIYYGGSESAGNGQCDNSGSIVIKGISYPIDFRRK